MPLDDHTAMAGCWASRFPCAAARVAGLPALEWFRCHDSSTREPRIFPATGTNDAAKDGAAKEDQGIGPGVCPEWRPEIPYLRAADRKPLGI
jgi:hypothetical protein